MNDFHADVQVMLKVAKNHPGHSVGGTAVIEAQVVNDDVEFCKLIAFEPIVVPPMKNIDKVIDNNPVSVIFHLCCRTAGENTLVVHAVIFGSREATTVFSQQRGSFQPIER